MTLPAEIAEMPDALSALAGRLRKSVQVIRGLNPSQEVMDEMAVLVLIWGAIGAESLRLHEVC